MSTSTGLVVVVDDDVAVRSSLKFALEAEGLHVRSHPGAEEALEDPELPAAGCLVVDYHMPGMNGVDLVAELRRRHVGVPAILITARSASELRLRGVHSAFHQVLDKPLQDGALLEAILSALAGLAGPSVEPLRGSI
jgi:two-component system response regulator FixJ